MSKAEILGELPKLSREDRSEILDRLWALEEEAGPSEREKLLLEEAQAAYDADPTAGAPWAEVQARLRKRP
jgi:putative addiction module component (TIGR02574 family)